MQNPLSLLGLVKLCFLCCKLACIVPSTLTQLTFAPPQIQHIFQTKIQFFYNINFFGILILVLLFSLRLFYSRKKHFPNECPCPWQALSPRSQKIISFFTECRDSSYSGPNDRAQITKTICNVVRCFAFLHQFAHQRIVWPPALLACRPNFILLFLITYWHLLKISDLQTKKLVLLKAFDISMVLLTTLLSAIICDADWTLRQNLPVNSRQV